MEALAKTALSEDQVTAQEQEPGFAVQRVEVARVQGCESAGVVDMKKPRAEHGAQNVEFEGDADMVLGEPQEGSAAYAGGIDTIVEGSAERKVALAVPLVDDSTADNLAAASC